MKCPPIFLRLAILMFFQFCAPLTRAAETNAVIPYQTLDNMFQPIAKIDPAKLQVQVFISTKTKTVHPSNITLTIHSASRGLVSLSLNTNGQILNFPHDKDLLRENPSVVANQPKGTLQLNLAIQLTPPAELAFHYVRLGDGVAEVNKAIRAQVGFALSLLAPKATGVVFIFPKASAGKATVTTVEIASVAGKKEYLADTNGRVKLKLEKALLAENPVIKVSEKPARIVPDFE